MHVHLFCTLPIFVGCWNWRTFPALATQRVALAVSGWKSPRNGQHPLSQWEVVGSNSHGDDYQKLKATFFLFFFPVYSIMPLFFLVTPYFSMLNQRTNDHHPPGKPSWFPGQTPLALAQKNKMKAAASSGAISKDMAPADFNDQMIQNWTDKLNEAH